MSRNCISMSVAPDAVFDVLENPYAYPRWVVGTRRVRGVDAAWPAVGSRFFHALGTVAGELHDSSKVLEWHRPERVSLEVRFRPTGVARVEIDIAAEGLGSVVTIVESPIRGPISRLPWFITDPLLIIRNALSLQRLRHEVERGKRQPEGRHGAPLVPPASGVSVAPVTASAMRRDKASRSRLWFDRALKCSS